jgi:LysR family transcriptional regulator, transcriptional activator of the cysJI operon
MNLNQLHSFLTVIDAGSLTKAAERLFLTQPALSLQIKALEEEFGQLLFERDGKQLRLTNAGRVLQERAGQILDLVEQTRQDVTGFTEFQRGQLTIAANETTCLYVLPSLLQSFCERFPGLEIRLLDRRSAEIAALVADGEADFGLATLPVMDTRISTQPLFWREDVAICGNGHPLARQESISVTDLAHHTLLLLEKGSTSRLLIEQRLTQHGVVPKATMALGSIEIIKRLAAINLGVAIVPGVAIKEEVRTGQLRLFRLEWLQPRTVGLIQRRNGYLSPASQLFLKLLRNHVPNVLLSPRPPVVG